ncbi:MAG: sigma-70 family RNA polymerase sigma factor [Bacteroidota bacterium]
MNTINYSDTDIVTAIKRGGRNRQEVIRFLYGQKDLKSKIIQFVQRNSGNFQDGQDIFHEGIIVLDRNVRQGKFKMESSVNGYLFSICRFLWMNQIRKHSKTSLTEDNSRLDEVEEGTPETQLFSDEQKNILRQLMSNLGERCQKILELWKLSYSMEEIAKELKFSSAAMARKNKYRCQKSLMDIVGQHPELVAGLR